MVKRRFGATGKPVMVPMKAAAKAKMMGGRLYEDGSVGGSGQLRGSKASVPYAQLKGSKAGWVPPSYAGDLKGSKAAPKPPPPGANAGVKTRPTAPQPTVKARALPKPPPKRR